MVVNGRWHHNGLRKQGLIEKRRRRIAWSRCVDIRVVPRDASATRVLQGLNGVVVRGVLVGAWVGNKTTKNDIGYESVVPTGKVGVGCHDLIGATD